MISKYSTIISQLIQPWDSKSGERRNSIKRFAETFVSPAKLRRNNASDLHNSGETLNKLRPICINLHFTLSKWGLGLCLWVERERKAERKSPEKMCWLEEMKMEVGGLVRRKCLWGWSCEWHMTKSRYVLTVAFNEVDKFEPIK